MTLFFSMLPVYLLGNLHCMGMCGPLVMMIGQHRYRYYYFAGRTLSFALAGLLAGGLGAVIELTLRQYHVSAAASFLFGGLILMMGVSGMMGWGSPGMEWLARRLAPLNRSLSLLMLKDEPGSSFLFGFFTLALPCGQTVVVFSACALAGDALVGFFNGFAFALLTSPALFFAMQTHRLFQKAQRHYTVIFGACALLVGALAICRGLAEIGWISHWVLSTDYHIVIF